MGAQCEATCRKCGHSFTYMEGPLMRAVVLRCDEKCGREKLISIEDVGEEHFTYGPDSSIEHNDERVRFIEDVAAKMHGKSCGGRPTFDASHDAPSARALTLTLGIQD